MYYEARDAGVNERIEGKGLQFNNNLQLLPLANASGRLDRFPRVLDLATFFVAIVNITFASLSCIPLSSFYLTLFRQQKMHFFAKKHVAV